MPLYPLCYNDSPAITIYVLIAKEYPGVARRFPLLMVSTEPFSVLQLSSSRFGLGGMEWWGKRKEEILVHSLFSTIMNALSGRIHQRSLWGEEMSGKVMVCWLLTHVAQSHKVIEVQKMSCCCTSSICKAVSQDK